MALNHLVGHTPAGSQYRSLFLAGIGGGGLKGQSETEIIRDLKLLCRDHPVRPHAIFFPDPKSDNSTQATAHDAFKALVNLSDSSVLAGPLSETTFPGLSSRIHLGQPLKMRRFQNE
jgi:hypothetical protein